MATHIASPIRETSWNWLRIGSLSGTFGVHVVALLMLAIPIAMPPPKPPAATVSIQWIEAPPEPIALPIPPEPLPQKRPSRKTAPMPVAVPTPTIVAETSMPVAVTESPADSVADIATTSPALSTGPASDLANITLGYESVVDPSYPLDAKRRGEHGTVLLRVLVGIDGLPKRIDIARSSGSSRLDRAARDAVQRWRFRPVQIDGKYVPATGLVPIAFNLDRG
jgi:protein TonB